MDLGENKQVLTSLLPDVVGELGHSVEKMIAGTKHLWTRVK